MTANIRQIEFLARAIVNRLEDRGLIEFHDAETGIQVVVNTLNDQIRRFEVEDTQRSDRP